MYPFDVFTDIFVCKESGWPRTGERRRGKGMKEEGGGLPRKLGYLGVLAIDSRVRIGLRIDFLAASPGVPSIDTLTLTDVETGFAMNLRMVMDIVVHDRDRINALYLL